MPLSILLEPVYFFQAAALALSIFNLVTFLWLACTVWLNGDRHRMIARIGVVGLGFSALFFYIHSLLISSPFSQSANLVSADFLWHLIWLPALSVPYIWFSIGLHYASLMNIRWRRRRPLLLISSGVLGLAVFVLLIFNPDTLTFAGTLRLLAYNDVRESNLLVGGPAPTLILLPILFLCYVTFCAIGPWFTPSRMGRMVHTLWRAMTGRSGGSSLRKKLSETFWDDPSDVDALEEPQLSWHLARPILLLAALLMVGLTISLGILGVWSMLNWLSVQNVHAVTMPAPDPLQVMPFNLVLLDIFSTGCVALMILIIGYSIVRQGILIERPLARSGFFEQWRGIVVVATMLAIFIALLVLFIRSSLGSLLLITSLATVAYALFTWSNYTAHDHYIAMLGPFLRSVSLRHWLNTDLRKTEQNMEALFFHLCHDVLEVRCARLIVLTGTVRRSFNYRWPVIEGGTDTLLALKPGSVSKKRDGVSHQTSTREAGVHVYRVRIAFQGQPIICWVVPIYDDLGLVANLYLGPRSDRVVFTDEDMELAHACGQRILDTLRDHEAMLTVAGLLKRRIVDVKLQGAQQRRVLHDEILPQMHLALLRMEMLRSHVQSEREESTEASSEQVLDEAVEIISNAHRRLAAMMRATATSAPHRLERDGMLRAMRTMIDYDFQQAFDEVEWQVSEEQAAHIDEIVPPAIAELIFAAVQEVLRNAARHARGADLHRKLRLTFNASCNPHLEVIVADDGVGIASASSTTSGTGSGLMTHSSLLAIAGGSLTVKSIPGEGVTVRILLPAEILR